LISFLLRNKTPRSFMSALRISRQALSSAPISMTCPALKPIPRTLASRCSRLTSSIQNASFPSAILIFLDALLAGRPPPLARAIPSASCHSLLLSGLINPPSALSFVPFFNTPLPLTFLALFDAFASLFFFFPRFFDLKAATPAAPKIWLFCEAFRQGLPSALRSNRFASSLL